MFRDDVDVGGLSWDDVSHGASQLACRRASIFGRAPIRDDVEVALLVWGFLSSGMPRPLLDRVIEVRRPLFTDVLHEPLHQRRIAEAVDEDVLRRTPAELRSHLESGDFVLRAEGA
jgi:hypothetical protein